MDDPAAGEFEPGQDQSTATVKPALWKSWAFKAVRCQKQLNTDQMPASVQSWAILAGICSAALVAVVYIYGWHTSGASLLMLSPACLYVAVCLAQVVWIAASGPTPTAHRLRMLAATLQIYYFVFPIFQPRDKKPFRRITVHLIALAMDTFLTSELTAVSSGFVVPTTDKRFPVVLAVVWQGLKMSLSRLDNATDLEVACILFVPAVTGSCTSEAGPRNCVVMWAMGGTQLLLAACNCALVTAAHHLSHKPPATDEQRAHRRRLTLSLSTLVCEFGMIAIYAASLALRGASSTMTGDGDADSGSHVDGGLDALSSGRSNTTETMFIATSILLTIVACAVNVLGMRRLLRAGWTAVRRSTTAMLRQGGGTRRWSLLPPNGVRSGRVVDATLDVPPVHGVALEGEAVRVPLDAVPEGAEQAGGAAHACRAEPGR